MNDSVYKTRNLNEMVWITLSGIESVGTYRQGAQVWLEFPNAEECHRLVSTEDYQRYATTIHRIKNLIKGEV